MFRLVVHEASLKYVRHTVAWMLEKITAFNHAAGFQRVNGRDRANVPDAFLDVVSDVSNVKADPGTVLLVIGDAFPAFNRQPGCRYVFVNFSLLYNLGTSNQGESAALAWIWRKHAAMLERAGIYDDVLDFLPEQTPLLEKELEQLGVAVEPYMVNVAFDIQTGQENDNKRWDLCIVGSPTPRRLRLYEQLAERGITLSPTDSNDLAATMLQSRVVLNVHAYDCVTCEYPRIIEALSLGCCLLTEPCIGLEKVLASDCFISTSFEKIPNIAHSLVGDTERRQEYGAAARRAVSGNYGVASHAAWNSVMARLSVGLQ